VHIGVPNADRAMAFFSRLFDWESERVEWEGHVRHYLVNTRGPQPVVTDEPDAPPVRLGFAVSDASAAARAIEEHDGTIGATGLSGDGGGWAMADDGQGIPLVVWRRDRNYPHAPATKPSRAVIEWIEVHVPDVERTRSLLRAVVGWVPNHMVAEPATRVKLYFTVDDLETVLATARELGGETGAVYATGPGRASDCTDDQGTRFSVWAEL
jgi:predicted enzyme related to lactoylglutathione lyase